MSNLTYIITLGPGKLARQATWLLQSIQQNTEASSADIISFVAKTERAAIPDDTLTLFERDSLLIEGEIPNPAYPLSAAHAALVLAAEQSTNDYLILLDTDTVVLDEPTVPAGTEHADPDLFLVPENVTRSYWADLSRSQDVWKELYSAYDIQYPSATVRSTVDDEMMVPYFNGGVILLRNGTDFPERYRDLSREVYDRLDGDFYSDQVALALLSNVYDTEILPEQYNYMQKTHVCPPPNDTNVIHYADTISLYRSLFNPTIKRHLTRTDVVDYFDAVSRPSLYYGVAMNLLKAYVLSHPESVISKWMDKSFQLKLKTENRIHDMVP